MRHMTVEEVAPAIATSTPHLDRDQRRLALFASEQAGAEGIADRDDAFLLPVQEGFRLGKLSNPLGELSNPVEEVPGWR